MLTHICDKNAPFSSLSLKFLLIPLDDELGTKGERMGTWIGALPPQCIRVVRSEGAGCRYGTEGQEDENVACDDKVQGQLVPRQQMALLAYG